MKAAVSDLSDRHPSTRIVLKPAANLAVSDNPTASDREQDGGAENRVWSPAGWLARMRSTLPIAPAAPAETVTALHLEPAAPVVQPKPPSAPERPEASPVALLSGYQRPPGWSDPDDGPQAGEWCGCCSRWHRRPGRWWRETDAPRGWRCWTCHPPVHLAPGEVVEVRT